MLNNITAKFNPERLAQVAANHHYLEELKVVSNDKVAKYYLDIIENVEINRGNPNNSYIMWLVGKVDSVDVTKASLIRPGRSKMPDIDMDFPVRLRGLIIEYIKTKYGTENVSGIATYGTLHGREALTQVLKVHEALDFDEIKSLTGKLPQESEISDKLQEMKEATGESSIILWALQNHPDDFGEFCRLMPDGSFSGPMAAYFAQAMRLEGCKRTRGTHASGIVVSPVPLSIVCPMLYDKNNDTTIAGLEYEDLESAGGIKLDILGVAVVDKIMSALHFIATGVMRYE